MPDANAHPGPIEVGALTCERLRNGESTHSVPEHDAVAAAIVVDGDAVAVPRNVRVRIALDDALEPGHGAVHGGNVLQRLHGPRQSPIRVVRGDNMCVADTYRNEHGRPFGQLLLQEVGRTYRRCALLLRRPVVIFCG